MSGENNILLLINTPFPKRGDKSVMASINYVMLFLKWHLSLLVYSVWVASLLTTQTFAQDFNKDSLLSLHHTGLANDTAYNNLIWSYVFNQPDSAIYFANRGFEWCEKTTNQSYWPA